jgi:hypothetical protein
VVSPPLGSSGLPHDLASTGSPSPLSLVFSFSLTFLSFFRLFLGGLCALFESFGFRRFAALRLRLVLYAPPPRHSPIATFLSDVSGKSCLSLLRLIVLLFVLCFLWFPYILFSLFYFVLILICILFLLGFSVFALIFSYIASLYLFRVFLVFTVLPIFSVLVSPLSVHCRTFFRTPTASSFQRVLQCTRFSCM